jgi:hypothetical protein
MYKRYVLIISAFLLIFTFLVQVSTALSAYDFKSFHFGKHVARFSSPSKHPTEKKLTYYSLQHLFLKTESVSRGEPSLDFGSSSFVYPDTAITSSRTIQKGYFFRSSRHMLLPLLQVFRI